MDESADHDVIGLGRVKYEMRLKPEATVAHFDLIRTVADAGKIGDQAKCTVETLDVGLSLRFAECTVRENINRRHVGLGPLAEAPISHCAQNGL